MGKKIITLLLSCIASVCMAGAQDQSVETFAYLSPEVQQSFAMLEKVLPNHGWSLAFKSLCKDIYRDGNLAPYEPMVCITDECLAVLAQHKDDVQLASIASDIQEYKKLLLSGSVCLSAKDALSLINDDEQAVVRSGCCNFCPVKPKKFLSICSTLLTVKFLSVTGTLLVNGVNFNNLISVANAAAIAGAVGATGATGAQGPIGIGGLLGAAEFIRTIQSPNNSIPPGTAFTIDTQVYNNIPAVIIASAGAGGTVFTLSTTGTYVVDYAMSLGSAGSVGIYTGPSAGSLTLDPNTVAGSTTATTWIHGRAFVTVGATPVVFAISSVVGTAAVVTAGTDAGSYMIRLTIMKIATT